MSTVNEKIEDAFNKFKVEFNRKGFAYSGTGAEIFKAGYEAAMKEGAQKIKELESKTGYHPWPNGSCKNCGSYDD